MTPKEALKEYIKYSKLPEIDFYSQDDRTWEELKRNIIENVEEYELITNIVINSIVERNNEIFIYKGLYGLGHKLEVLHNSNMGEYISSDESVGLIYEGEMK